MERMGGADFESLDPRVVRANGAFEPSVTGGCWGKDAGALHFYRLHHIWVTLNPLTVPRSPDLLTALCFLKSADGPCSLNPFNLLP